MRLRLGLNLNFIIQYLCKNERNWTSSHKTTCDSDVHGIELNTDGFRYCYSATRWLMPLHVDEYEWLGREVININSLESLLYNVTYGSTLV